MKRVGLKQVASLMKQFDETDVLKGLSVKEILQLIVLYHRVIRTYLLHGCRVNIHGYGTYRVLHRRPRFHKAPMTGQGTTSRHFVADFAYSKSFLHRFTIMLEGDYERWLKGRDDNDANRKEYLDRINQQNQLVLLE